MAAKLLGVKTQRLWGGKSLKNIILTHIYSRLELKSWEGKRLFLLNYAAVLVQSLG